MDGLSARRHACDQGEAPGVPRRRTDEPTPDYSRQSVSVNLMTMYSLGLSTLMTASPLICLIDARESCCLLPDSLARTTRSRD
jgi:hypothetical protein